MCPVMKGSGNGRCRKGSVRVAPVIERRRFNWISCMHCQHIERRRQRSQPLQLKSYLYRRFDSTTWLPFACHLAAPSSRFSCDTTDWPITRPDVARFATSRTEKWHSCSAALCMLSQGPARHVLLPTQWSQSVGAQTVSRKIEILYPASCERVCWSVVAIGVSQNLQYW